MVVTTEKLNYSFIDEESVRLKTYFYNAQQTPASSCKMILFLVAVCGPNEGFIIFQHSNYPHMCYVEQQYPISNFCNWQLNTFFYFYFLV